MDPPFRPMLHSHQDSEDIQPARDFGPIAPPPRKDQQAELSSDAETASQTEPAAGEKPKKKHKRHNRQRKRRHKGSKTDPEPASDAVEQKTMPLDKASGIHQVPLDPRLQNPTFVQHILPKWLQKPINVTRSNFDGTYRFDYAPSLQHLHVPTHLHWPKAFAYHIVPELFQFNPRAYIFFPGRTQHNLLLNKLGEGGASGTRASGQPSWDHFIEEQAAAMKYGIASEDLLGFRTREQAWATWWAVRWAFTGRTD